MFCFQIVNPLILIPFFQEVQLYTTETMDIQSPDHATNSEWDTTLEWDTATDSECDTDSEWNTSTDSEWETTMESEWDTISSNPQDDM